MLLGRVTAVEQIAILCWIYLSAATMSGSPRRYASGYRRLSRSNDGDRQPCPRHGMHELAIAKLAELVELTKL